MESILTKIAQIIGSLGLTLDQYQPHLSGERFLMMRNKLVLIGRQNKTGEKVVIKTSDQTSGKKEIRREKKVRDLMNSLAFSDDSILFPAESYFGRRQNYLIWITKFIPQEKVFVRHSLEEQFFTALRAFEAQEAFHATTYGHLRQIGDTFPVFSAQNYLVEFKKFRNGGVMTKALNYLADHRAIIDLYANHLIHTDFVPHNFRISGNQIYMLDSSSFCFGNKYEGWARFLNYMVIHNPQLENLLLDYLKQNRDPKEYLALRLMRIYKTGYLLNYYADSLAKTTGDLRALTQRRLDFWRQVLEVLIKDQPLPSEVLEQYLADRDQLRSAEEKERQREFAVA